MVKITKVEEHGNGVYVTLSSGTKHWISNDNWTTKEELKRAVKAAEDYIKRKNTVAEKVDMQTLVGEDL